MCNLEVRPLSCSSTICLLQELNVPVNDVEEQTVSVGELEALNLLKASLTYIIIISFDRGPKPKHEEAG